MERKELKDQIAYEIENADNSLLNHVAEAIASYKKARTKQEDHHTLLKEALDMSLAQAARGETISWTDTISESRKRLRAE